jgi:hypothetical protein
VVEAERREYLNLPHFLSLSLVNSVQLLKDLVMVLFIAKSYGHKGCACIHLNAIAVESTTLLLIRTFYTCYET